MRLLLDQNLSRRLVARLADVYPGSAHVAVLGLERATDQMVWERVRLGGYVLVTKDADFDDPMAFPGPPPKVVRLTLGNGPTDIVESMLRDNVGVLQAFALDGRRLLRIGERVRS